MPLSFALGQIIFLSTIAWCFFRLTGAMRTLDARIGQVQSQLLHLSASTKNATPPGHSHDHLEAFPSENQHFALGEKFDKIYLDTSRWSVWIGLSATCSTCTDVIADLQIIVQRLAQFNVCAIVDDRGLLENLSGVKGGQFSIFNDRELVAGAPFVVMIDPDRVVQGSASIRDSAQILEFVAEGHASGIGPGLDDPSKHAPNHAYTLVQPDLN